MTDAHTIEPHDVASFVDLLRKLTGLEDANLPSATQVALEGLYKALGPPPATAQDFVLAQFYGRLNQKLAASREIVGRIYKRAASRRVTFNYHDKREIQWAVDTGDRNAFLGVLQRCIADDRIRTAVAESFGQVPHHRTRELLIEEADSPTKLRKAHQRSVRDDVLSSSTGSLVWSLWPTTALHRVFDARWIAGSEDSSFLDELKRRLPELFVRSRSLAIRRVRGVDEVRYEEAREHLTSWLAAEYDHLDNYGFAAILLDVNQMGPASAFKLSADLMLFGERFRPELNSRSYFRWREVAEETSRHTPTLNVADAAFELMPTGFTFRDQIIIHSQDGACTDILVLFQKNDRDETLVPCPACRSADVAGNSYPSLGVKSWECRNPLCPDKSIYDRGKRYSFKSLLTQAAIEDESNLIEESLIRRWQRDVVLDASPDEVLEMLVRMYSMAGDVVAMLDTDSPIAKFDSYLQREVVQTTPPPVSDSDQFWSSAFFKRYIVEAERSPNEETRMPRPGVTIEHGDALDVLRTYGPATFDGGVTSPPYYNAREYAQWPNLYCYLSDMHQIHREVFRVLRPGALYFFNVFDYYDNERIINFSLMGQKRIALSAHFVDLFRRIGFRPAGCVVWDKGSVQGSRHFNAGNRSPFYQSPMTCWEHVLIFEKPSPVVDHRVVASHVNGTVQRIHPVMKMVKGENRFGHTAPFPEAIPDLLLRELSTGSCVLDPFGGSGTTAVAAVQRGVDAVLIEQNADYCALARRRVADATERARNIGLQGSIF